jgi:redox-sensing transcriptional repressor
MGEVPVVQSTLPEATVTRLHRYRRILGELAEVGHETVSSDVLAEEAGVNSAQVRKDLSLVGSRGKRGVGYQVVTLRDELTHALGLTHDWRVLIAGIGNLGRALASYRGFHEPGFSVVALVDDDPALFGESVAGLFVESIGRLDEIVAREQVDIAIMAVPADVAQDVADRLTETGVTAILNFAPTHVSPARDARVRRVDLSSELGVLAYYEQSSGSLDSSGETGHASRTADSADQRR